MRRFGLIGSPLTHSFSRTYFTEKFINERIDGCSYGLYPLDSITEFPSLIESTPELEGINVTIPYKEQVLQYLDEADEVVSAIKACNCIRRRGNGLKGYNTDVTGFRLSLAPLYKDHHRRALILGTGGASKAVAYVLLNLGLSIQYVSRTPSDVAIGYEELSPELMSTHTLIVNTTPLGTYPAVDTAPPILYDLLTPEHYLFDLVYNPAKTLFLQRGEQQGAVICNGHDMLKIQAEESWKIWNQH